MLGASYRAATLLDTCRKVGAGYWKAGSTRLMSLEWQEPSVVK